jgi:hypothetical protein
MDRVAKPCVELLFFMFSFRVSEGRHPVGLF